MKQTIKSSLLHALVAAILVGIPMHQAQSAPGTLPTSPLYLATIVEPNVFLTVDDSASMSWRTLVSPDTTEIRGADLTVSPEGLPNIGGSNRVFLHPRFYTFHPNVVPPVSLHAEAWVLKNSDANKIYYDPNVTYEPWAGTDAFGNPLYTDVNPINAPMFPFDLAQGLTDLTVPYIYDVDPFSLPNPEGTIFLPTYYEWGDTNLDGVIDADTDARRLIEIKPANAPFPSGRNYAEEIQNFANWFSYYRTRELTTKAVMGKIINNSNSNRMGLRFFNLGHQIDAATMSNPINKTALLQKLYNPFFLGASTGTRRALEATGLMFANDGVIPTPILPAVNGGTCQQNFNLLMTDGFANGLAPTWGTKKPSDTNNTDVDSGVAVSIFDGDAGVSNDGGNYADSHVDTLADVAMHYYENDLDPAMLDEVPVRPGIDEATHQHLVNYTLSLGLRGSLDPDVHPTDTVTPFAGWPDPSAAGINTIDDLWHASYNSRGKHLYVDSTAELESQLSLAATDVSERTGTVTASVAVNSAKLSTTSTVYLATFFSDFWNGDLSAFIIKDLDTGELNLSSEWEAGPKLTSRIGSFGHDNNNRPIITYDPATGAGLPFTWTSITAAMQADFNTSPSGAPDALGQSRFDYVRGDRSNENIGGSIVGNGFRERASLLGDIVNSSPVYVGPPNLAWPDATPFPTGANAYSEFKTAKKNRKSVLFVGANDGMLHAFEDDGDNDPNNGIANGGNEIFAYVPGQMYSSGVANQGLHYLSDPNYIHNYYVDLTPTVSDVFFSTGSWRTVLVGGLRGGGRGLFALDVTDPNYYSSAKDATKADAVSLWEFTDATDPELGYTFARPTIGLSNAGTWVAIFGNGYNSTGTGEASLFIVDIEKGADGTWSAGDWTRISTGVGTAGAQNGLAAPALADIDGNGTIDRAYAGDLEGNMWVFDLSGSTTGSWKVAYTSGATPVPLFTTPVNQPITAKPVLATHPTQPDDNQNSPNIMVYFGTGQYLVSGDKVTTDLQSFYGVWDKGDNQLLNTDLIQQTFDVSFSGGRVLTRNPIDYSIDHGWYFNLTDSGERAVTTPIARADTVFFNTFVPSDVVCDRGGYGYRFAVDMATGGSPLVPTIDSNGDGLIDDNDYQNNGIDKSTLAAVRQEGFLPEPVFIEDLAFTGDKAAKIKALSTVPSGRFSWQELLF